MTTQSLTLSMKGMMNITSSRAENDFTFIVGEHRHRCPWFIADFLSPKIGRLHSIDPCMNEMIIETADRSNAFSAFLALGRGSRIEVTDANRSFLNSIARELCNPEVYFSVNEDFEKNGNPSKLWEQLVDSELIDYIADPNPSIDFLASHFFEIEFSVLKKSPVSLLTRILSSHSLRIATEDSLYEIIRSHLDSDPNSIYLLEYVRFEFLTCDVIENFISWSFDHFEDFHVSRSLWDALSRRLLLSVRLPDISTTEYRMTRLCYPTAFLTPEIPLNGIIAHLTREFKGNVHEKGIVDISAKTIDQNLEQFQAKWAANLYDMSYFQAPNVPNQWIRYDFKTRRVRLTHYTIFPHLNGYWLRSWILEGSLDGSDDSWDELDRHKDDTTMNRDCTIGTFTVTRSNEYRFIRLRQTGKNHNGNDYMILFAFEIFGELLEPSVN
jgi:hypothetical protein